jgi:hypothetical protein
MRDGWSTEHEACDDEMSATVVMINGLFILGYKFFTLIT